jgi:ABC-type multidrug transport system ATPase subunit
MKLALNELQIKQRRKTIVANATMEVDCGVHGLLGVNGAGKTTLLRAMATGIKPKSGSYTLDQQPVWDHLQDARSAIGYAPQRPIAIRHLTAEDQVRYAAWLKGHPAAKDGPLVADALDLVGLSAKRDEKVGRLSGGMLKRLGIAMAIVTDPQVLLLDEPTAGLDPNQRHRFHQLVNRLRETTTIILSTHLVEDIATLCDTITILNEGVTTFSGTPEQLKSNIRNSLDGVFEMAVLNGLTRP